MSYEMQQSLMWFVYGVSFGIPLVAWFALVIWLQNRAHIRSRQAQERARLSLESTINNGHAAYARKYFLAPMTRDEIDEMNKLRWN